MPATGMLLFYLDANLLIPTPSQMKKTLLPIQAVAGKLEILGKYVEQIGPYGAKLRLELLADPAYTRRGKLILVTATSPTVSGEGKTVTAIGLTQGLALLGKRVPRASLRSAR
jgi:formate--tetrahydrofolate ligase